MVAFYIDEMNFRGVVNSTFQYSFYNQSILKNKSIIFYNRMNKSNKKEVINRFKKKFKVFSIKNFSEIENYLEKYKIKYIYTQKGGEKNSWVSKKIKTLVHFVYPQKNSEIHGYKYVCVSNWLNKQFSNNKLPVLPYIVELNKTNQNLRKKLNIKKNQIVIGCHGGESSFDLNFVKDTLIDITKKKNNIVFLFLNIDKFCNNSKIFFLKGTSNEKYKKSFLNTCDAMIYGRSLGESFGMSCGEFSILNKLIISYKFNRHRSHLDYLSSNRFIEYSSREKLFQILCNIKKNNKILSNSKNDYQKCKPKKIMQMFKKVFLTKSKSINFNLLDYFFNFFGFLKMNYFYIRHKIYNHYYGFFESKIKYYND